MIKRNIDFPAWLQKQIDEHEWRPTDLAKKSGLSDATVSRILKGERQADIDTLMAFASALTMSPMSILRKAFIFPDSEGEDVNWEDWKFLISQMTHEEEQTLKQIGTITVERRQKLESSSRAKNFKPRKVG